MESVATGDLNGDHNPDLVMTSRDTHQQQAVTVLLGGGDGTFAPAATYGPDTNYLPTPALGDFNGDGNLDLAGGRSLYLGNGDGTFQEPSDFLYYAYYWTTVGDYEGDGKLDLAGINFDRVGVLQGNGDDTFQPAQSFAAGPSPGFLHAADMNSDSVLDLVLTNYSTDGVDGGLTVLLGNGDGSFAPPITTTVAGHPSWVALADFNADGLPDVAVSNSSNAVSVLLNDGNWSAAMPGDVNGDGAVDILDINVVSAHWGGPGPIGDANHDGSIDIFDINLISANWTGPQNSSVSTEVSPPAAQTTEPTSLSAEDSTKHTATPLHTTSLPGPVVGVDRVFASWDRIDQRAKGRVRAGLAPARLDDTLAARPLRLRS